MKKNKQTKKQKTVPFCESTSKQPTPAHMSINTVSDISRQLKVLSWRSVSKVTTFCLLLCFLQTVSTWAQLCEILVITVCLTDHTFFYYSLTKPSVSALSIFHKLLNNKLKNAFLIFHAKSCICIKKSTAADSHQAVLKY